MKSFVQDTTYREDVGAWISPNRQQVIMTQGQRGSGKSNLNEFVAEELHNNGWTVLDLWASDNLENCFWCVNCNCKEKYGLMRQEHPEQKEEIHCNCNIRYPISILCPDYIEWDNNALDHYNGVFYTKNEWIAKLRNQGEVIVEYDRIHPPRKPDCEVKNWIKIKHLPKPSKTDRTGNNELIVQKFIEALLEARKERRILVFNPKLFPNEFEKFKTLEIIIRSLGDIAFCHFKQLTEKEVGKPRSQWTKEQICWHRMVVVMRELGELTASVLKGENESTLAKKAILNFIRKARHYNISLCTDYQRPEDAFSGVRDQANIFVLKRAPKRLFGDEWIWAFDQIVKERQKIFDKMGYNQLSFRKANEKWPRIEELNMNRAYVVYSNDRIRLWEIPTPNFHHKQPEDHFEQITGISFRISQTHNESVLPGTSSTMVTESNEKVLHSFIFQLRNPTNGKTMNWEDVLKYLAQEQEKGTIKWKNPFKEMKPNTISKWYARMNRRYNLPEK